MARKVWLSLFKQEHIQAARPGMVKAGLPESQSWLNYSGLSFAFWRNGKRFSWEERRKGHLNSDQNRCVTWGSP